VATLLQKKIREILDPALQTAGHAARVIGQAAQSDVLCSSLLAIDDWAAKWRTIHVITGVPRGLP
jgi:hypothetical protein